MTSEAKAFEDLVKEAPEAERAGTVSLVGTLARSSEPGKFVLVLQDGGALTLEIAAVKGHAVLGSSLGRTIVRVDVESSKAPASVTAGAPQFVKIPFTDTTPYSDTGLWWDEKFPWQDQTKPHLDIKPWLDPGQLPPYFGAGPVQPGGAAPFALATPQQVPPATLAALQGPGASPFKFPPLETGWPDVKPPYTDNTGLPDVKLPLRDTGWRDKHPILDATGAPPYLD